ncbi:hypothetical protein ACFQY7_16020 [Actinomadura luteofluorescens]|uniref:hypothetical protein n=1 Tax=Actinomadura luteofluorescens TaxID=46163 RepID=UPI003626C67F
MRVVVVSLRSPGSADRATSRRRSAFRPPDPWLWSMFRINEAGRRIVEVFETARLGPLTLRNRVIKAATSEGMTPDALVTDDLIEYHRRPAAAGWA